MDHNDEYKGEIEQGNVKKEEMVKTAPQPYVKKEPVATGPQTQSQNTNTSQRIEVQLKFQQHDNDDDIKEWIEKNSVLEFDANKPLYSLIENLFAKISLDLSKKAEITSIAFDDESSGILLVNEENLNKITEGIKDFKGVKIVQMMILLKD